MNELFVRLFLSELRKAGFHNAVYDAEQQSVIISPEYTRLFVKYEDGEYLIHYDAESCSVMPVIKSIRDKTRMVTAAWELSEPDGIPGTARFHKLIEWNGVVLAARDDGERGLHLVTWLYDSDRQGVSDGHYTNDVTGAMRDFTGRSGLIPKDRIFNDGQLDVIRSALAYKLENDDEIKPDDEKKIKSLLFILEP